MSDFFKVLDRNKKSISKQWFSYTLDTYPTDTSSFLKNNHDPFNNPVGKITFDSLNELFKNLVCYTKNQEFELIIDPIIRVRAVQNFKPSEAVSFIFALKKIVNDYLYNRKIKYDYNELMVFYGRVDTLAMVAFDKFMACKEQIYELKANESKNQFFGSLSRAGLIVET